MKVMWNGREVEISPTIEALLKKRGWTFPPTEEMRREWREAGERLAGSLSTPYEVLAEIAAEEARWDDYRWYLEQIEKEKQKTQEEEGGADACAAPDVP